MADKIIPDDLRNTSSPNKTQDYFLVTLNELIPNETYRTQFAWVYEDKTVGDWSATYSAIAPAEMVNVTPDFLTPDLSGGKGFLTVKWRGVDVNNNLLTGIKQVNIWISGGQYGNDYVKLAESFNSPSTKTIYVTPGRYYVKLQAVTYSGLVSNFSLIQNAWSLKTPLAATSVSGTWIAPDGSTKSDTLKVGFTFDPTFENTTTSGKDVDSFRITLTAYGLKKSFLFPVDKTTTAQKFYLSPSENVSNFGIFATSFTVGITTIITGLSESTLVEETSLTYVTPLDVPVITLKEGILLYTVTWNNQTGKPFDQIYIEEVESNAGTAPSTGWTQVAQGLQNPLTVQTLNANKRWVRAKFYDSHGVATSYSSASAVTPNPAVTVDNTGPDNVNAGSVTTTAGIDTSGYLGFNGYIDVSWPSVTGGGIRGYRIRFSNDGGTTYSYVDSPGTASPAGTTITYRLGGLAIGSTYKIAVATYDEFNNTSSSYISATDRLIPGTPSMSNYISAGNMKLGYGVNESNDKGLYLDSSNYWYLNATNSARLNVGGSTSNYLNWNGSLFSIDGNITARSGYFKGNVEIQSGGSLFSGVLFDGQIVGAGYILNNTGISFSYGSTATTTIAASTGKLTTISANIGGWDVNSNTISKNGITLNSSGSITANNGAYYVGIKPQVSSPTTDIVLWAGQSTDGTSPILAPFRVTGGGTLYASDANINGVVKAKSGFIGSTDGVNATGFNFTNEYIESVQPNASTATKIKLDGTAGTISGGVINGTTITASLFQSKNYGIAGYAGIAIASSTGIPGESLLFNFGGTREGAITVVNGRINIAGRLNGDNYMLIDSTNNYSYLRGYDLQLVSVRNASITSGGTSIISSTGSATLESTGIGTTTTISGPIVSITTTTGDVGITAADDISITANGGAIVLNSQVGSTILQVGGTPKLSLASNAASITGGTNELNLTSTTAQLTSSHQADSYGLRKIQFYQSASSSFVPSVGSSGDIVLVYA